MSLDLNENQVIVISINPGITREEIAQIVSGISAFKEIYSYRYIYNGTICHLSLFIVEFPSKDVKEQIIRAEIQNQEISFINYDPFYSHPHLAFIFGLPIPDKASAYSETFTSYGVTDMRVIEHPNCKNDYILGVAFDDKQTFKMFLKNINNSYMLGNKISVVPFKKPDNIIKYCPLMNDIYNVIGDPNSYDFTLLYFDREFKCWSGAAISQCSQIANLFENSEEDITEFIVPQIPGPFELIVDYINGKTIQINDKNAPFLLLMSEQLGILELYNNAHRFVYECGDLDSIIVLLEQLFYLKGNYLPLLTILANNFEKVYENITIRRYPIELLEMLISSDYFSLKNEDELLEYIYNNFHTDKIKFHYLIKQIKIEKLTNQSLLKLISDSNFDLNSIRNRLVNLGKQIHFCRKPVCYVPSIACPINIERHHSFAPFGDIFRGEFIDCVDGKIFSGIFNHLKQFTNGENPHEAGIIELSYSSSSHGDIQSLIESDSYVWFATQDIKNSYIMFDFKQRTVSLTGYSLKTHSYEGNGHITGWKINGSNDKITWDEVDEVAMTELLGTLGAEHYFKLETPSRFYRYFQLIQTRKNTKGFYNLRLSRVEFFGSIQHFTKNIFI